MASNKDWDQFNKRAVMMLAEIKYNPDAVDKYLSEFEILMTKEEVAEIIELKKNQNN